MLHAYRESKSQMARRRLFKDHLVQFSIRRTGLRDCAPAFDFDEEAFRVTSLVETRRKSPSTGDSHCYNTRSHRRRLQSPSPSTEHPPSRRSSGDSSRLCQDETPLKASTAYDVLVIIGWLGYGEMRQSLSRQNGIKTVPGTTTKTKTKLRER